MSPCWVDIPNPILLCWTRHLGHIVCLIIPCVGCVGDRVRSGHRVRLHRHHRLHANLRYEFLAAKCSLYKPLDEKQRDWFLIFWKCIWQIRGSECLKYLAFLPFTQNSKIFKNKDFGFTILEKGHILRPFSGISPTESCNLQLLDSLSLFFFYI